MVDTSGGIVGITRHAKAACQVVCAAATALRLPSVVAIAVAGNCRARRLVCSCLAIQCVAAITGADGQSTRSCVAHDI